MIRLLSSLRAEALQSILQLMGEKEMYEYWSQTYRVHNLEWSQEKAADILHAWQRKFTQVGVIWAYAATALALAAVPFDLVASLRIYIIFFFPFVGGAPACRLVQWDQELQDPSVLFRQFGQHHDRVLRVEHCPRGRRLHFDVGLRRSVAGQLGQSGALSVGTGHRRRPVGSHHGGGRIGFLRPDRHRFQRFHHPNCAFPGLGTGRRQHVSADAHVRPELGPAVQAPRRPHGRNSEEVGRQHFTELRQQRLRFLRRGYYSNPGSQSFLSPGRHFGPLQSGHFVARLPGHHEPRHEEESSQPRWFTLLLGRRRSSRLLRLGVGPVAVETSYRPAARSGRVEEDWKVRESGARLLDADAL